MNDQVHITTTRDQKPKLVELIRHLPAILSGRVSDVAGIANGFRSRIGYSILSLIAPNFNELGRGMTGADGDKWPLLSKAYLAYGRRFGKGEQAELKKQAGIGKGHSFAPGNKKGLLTADQLKLWRRTYADRLAWYTMRMPDNKAKARAAAIAWIVVKAAGAKTKLEVYGNRQVQILVDTGRLRGSLQPGWIQETGPNAEYQKPSGIGGQDQTFTSLPGEVIVGTNVSYGEYHHEGKRVPKRRLWPKEFPSDWWTQILGTAISGLIRISEIVGGGRGI